ncbi:TraR/DksA C4-type zinc finger protein [Asanoa sp. WMMD1127]|uniref:TraR/DksA family transcriptional regulator n=1 Tax=Asanoa sp. WMMD1127 TaxID=3016107 RepID=UPI002417CB9C|nr:TraR/DksA C4-type zinc finger protein [Asanoa sp. WMMD1127]MDG4824034.1 TraR/DksA C4-type zinc finger protein [Asanoa sp. WMMD1127]
MANNPVERLRDERRATVAQIEALGRVVEGIVTAQTGANTDDEHDPEGQTIAYERAQASALLQRARDRLVAIDDALRRVEDDSYGRCERCGRPIHPERLAALPATRTCVSCAA